MFPQALHRAEGPTKLRTSSQCALDLRGLRPGDGVGFIGHLPTRPMEDSGEVGILAASDNGRQAARARRPRIYETR